MDSWVTNPSGGDDDGGGGVVAAEAINLAATSSTASAVRTPPPSMTRRFRISSKSFTPKVAYRHLKHGTADFFGLPEAGDREKEEALKALWLERRKRFSAKKYGGLKEAYQTPELREGEDEVDFWRRTHSFHFTGKKSGRVEKPDGEIELDAGEVLSTSRLPRSAIVPPKPRKESVAKLTFEGISYLASTIARKKARLNAKQGPGLVPPKSGGRGWSRSFGRSSLGDVGAPTPATAATPSADSVFEWGTPSAARRGAKPHQVQPVQKRGIEQTDGFVASSVEETELGVLEEEAFFDRSFDRPRPEDLDEDRRRREGREQQEGEGDSSGQTKGGWKRIPRPDYESEPGDEGDARRLEDARFGEFDDYRHHPSGYYRPDSRASSSRGYSGARPPRRVEHRTPPSLSGVKKVGMRRVWTKPIGGVADNSDRRQYGLGLVGRLFGRSLKKSVAHSRHVRAQLDDMDDYRPYFTYWVTSVQIVVMVIALACYGFGPVGFTIKEQRGFVRVTNLVEQSIDYWEPANFWFGPRAADLIHLGAKFGPCMRHDEKIFAEVEKQRLVERDTACCVRNDHSGCAQTAMKECSVTLSTWFKWSEQLTGPDGRISGSVCGQDPRYCREPASIAPYVWPDDITKWPVCTRAIDVGSRHGVLPPVAQPDEFDGFDDADLSSLGLAEVGGGGGGGLVEPVLAAVASRMHHSEALALVSRELKDAPHMTCEVIAKPCCIGIHGDCRITTREYCDFVKGYFHAEAALCSQVSCLNDVCGMIPFYNPDRPNQFYRLWTSLFLHAGLLHLAITIVVQWYLMRDLEKMAGPFRIGVIYIMSGVAGNLASAIFIPYRADVGPAGAQFGLLSCLFVEVLNAWPMLRTPYLALAKLAAVTMFLFLVGLLPWVDNYSHLVGFVFGFLTAYALLPFVAFGPYDRRRRVVLIGVCLAAACLVFLGLVLLFYVVPVYECEVCKYLSCVPIVTNFCADQNINFNKKTVWAV